MGHWFIKSLVQEFAIEGFAYVQCTPISQPMNSMDNIEPINKPINMKPFVSLLITGAIFVNTAIAQQGNHPQVKISNGALEGTYNAVQPVLTDLPGFPSPRRRLAICAGGSRSRFSAGVACSQSRPIWSYADAKKTYTAICYSVPIAISEDCLYLNVWTIYP